MSWGSVPHSSTWDPLGIPSTRGLQGPQQGSLLQPPQRQLTSKVPRLGWLKKVEGEPFWPVPEE